jgi:hypothetical protein
MIDNFMVPSLSCCPRFPAALAFLLPSLSCCPRFPAALAFLLPSLSCCPRFPAALAFLLPSLSCCPRFPAALAFLLPSLSCLPLVLKWRPGPNLEAVKTAGKGSNVKRLRRSSKRRAPETYQHQKATQKLDILRLYIFQARGKLTGYASRQLNSSAYV